MNIKEYSQEIANEVKRQYEIIGKVKKIEIPVASDVGDRIEGLLSVLKPGIAGSGLADFIRQAEKKYSPNDWRVAIDSALAAAKSQFIKFNTQDEAIEFGIRVGLAYITAAIVSAPLEGFVKLEMKKRKDGQEYLACHFGGPIRGAGGTAAASVIVIADALRAAFNLGKYDADEDEISRIKVEVTDYNDFEARLQYMPSINELDFLMRNIPIEIEGDPTSDREVSAYKNLPRIKTNKIRGGMALVLCEGFAQKAPKVNKMLKVFGKDYGIDEDFSFLNQYIELKELSHSEQPQEKEKKEKVLPNYRYIEELAAGRPVFSYPLTSGGFRLRYGRSRVSGLAAASINPITNKVLLDFVATGSQLRVELPGKACAVTPCSDIEPPIVKLKDGSVVKLKSVKQAEELLGSIDEILYIGDILFNYGDFAEQGHLLMPSPFVSEWWDRIVETKGEEAVRKSTELNSFKDHLAFSKEYDVPLHPNYLYFWTQITREDLQYLVEYVYTHAKVDIQQTITGQGSKVLLLQNDEKAKRILELLGVEHKLSGGIVVQDVDALLETIGYGRLSFDEAINLFSEGSTSLEILSKMLGVKVMDSAGTFIGARLGRPEKAKMREMETNPNIIFPIGENGGSSRNLVAAAEKGNIVAEYGTFYCNTCKKDTIYSVCDVCGNKAERYYFCRVCGAKTNELIHHGKQTLAKTKLSINLKEYLERAYQKLGITERLPVIKAVKGVFNSTGDIEPIEKGILRSMHRLNVNKDGTVRFDAIEVPITHFKPKEVETSIERLKQLGYTEDVFGKELSDQNQILQLKPQDIILPTYGTEDENAAEVFSRVSKFVDDLLVKYYKTSSIMDIKTKDDLVGKLVVGLAPHTSSGTIGRIIGFSKTQGLFAHPFFHAAMRRNCDGDEAALLLLSDMLLNFDRALLPDSRGARYMDSPLVISTVMDLNSIDSEAYNLDIVGKYPLEFYEDTLRYDKPSQVKIPQAKELLSDPDKKILFTHDTDNINLGVNVSAYKTLETMSDKVSKQMELEEKLRAVDLSDIARIIIEKHFIKDIKGNLRRFGTEEFRCVKCNQRYKRAPLVGRCTKCGGNLVLTSSEGNIKKYLKMSLEIAQKYNVPTYIKSELELIKIELDALFGEKVESQASLLAF